jgi:hypothetical protein
MASILKVNEIQHTGGTSALTVDSSGRILTPNIVAFQANRTAGAVSSGNIYVCNNTTLNKGNAYSTSTGKFTCPVDGVYSFHAAVLTGNNQTSNDISLIKNSYSTANRQLRCRVDNGGDTSAHASATFNYIGEFTAGDTLYLYADSVDWFGTDFSWGQFGGRLIG